MLDAMEGRISAIGCLDDPVRRSVYEAVIRHRDGVDRAALADELGLARSTAAFHLERLTREGLLETVTERLNGRSGPGSGRPTKLYRRAATETSVSVPDRRYDLAADLMAQAIERSAQHGERITDSLETVARDAGAEHGRRAGSLRLVLQQTGYEPYDDGDGGYALANCPFHRLARGHAATVCALNVGFLSGARDGASDDAYAIAPAAPGAPCCAHIVREANR